jgi:hypothetical protein
VEKGAHAARFGAEVCQFSGKPMTIITRGEGCLAFVAAMAGINFEFDTSQKSILSLVFARLTQW